jgi:hypothetical protein
MVSQAVVYEKALVKNTNLPAMTDSQNWFNCISFLEKKLVKFDALDFTRNSGSFERWEISNDPTNWSSVSAFRRTELSPRADGLPEK